MTKPNLYWIPRITTTKEFDEPMTGGGAKNGPENQILRGNVSKRSAATKS